MELKRSLNPDEAVAYGASVQAAIMAGKGNERVQDIVLVDVITVSFGVETDDGIMSVVIPRNTTSPTKMTRNYKTVKDNQTCILFAVYEGERTAKDYYWLGEFRLSGIPAAPRGKITVVVSFDMDTNGILKVSARESTTGVSQKVTVPDDKARLAREEINRMIKDAENFKVEDEKYKEKAKAKGALEDYAYDLKSIVDDKEIRAKLEPESKKKMEDAICQVTQWLGGGQSASANEYKEKLKELKKSASPSL